MTGEGDYPPPRAIKGRLVRMALACDGASIMFCIDIENEDIGDFNPIIGSEVTIS